MSVNIRALTDAEIDEIIREKHRRKLTPEGQAIKRRRHLKMLYRSRHGYRLDASISQTRLKLEILLEIQAEFTPG